MKYNDLTITANKPSVRVGRGIAAGKGKTAGRGTKGQRSRTGSSRRPGFEGGQNPLMQRLPKLPGFKSKAVKPEIVYTYQLDQFGNKKVTTEVLAEAGLISNPYVAVKIIVKGNLTKKVQVEVQGVTASAQAAIEALGGEVKIVPRLGRPVTSQKKLEKEDK